MSWSDDTRCLHCDGKLPLYRKITSGQFCSAGHRKAYWLEQERLAVERLHQTHDSLRAYRPVDALEAAPKRAPLREPGPAPIPVADFAAGTTVEDMARSAANTGRVTFAGFVTERMSPRTGKAAAAPSALDFTANSADVLSLPARLTGVIAGEWGTAPRTPMPFFDAADFASASAPAGAHNGPDRLLPSAFAGSASLRIRFRAAPDTPEFAPEFVASLAAQPAGPEITVTPEIADAFAAESPAAEPAIAIHLAAAGPAIAIHLAAVEPAVAIHEAAVPVVPLSASLLALDKIGFRAGALAPRIAAREIPYPARNPLGYVRMPGAEGRSLTPAFSSLVPLVVTGGPRRARDAQPGISAEPQAIDLRPVSGAPPAEIPLPALAPALRLAPGSRYRMSEGRGAAVRNAKPAASNAPRLLALSIHENEVSIEAHSASAAGQTELEPVLAAGCRYTVSIQPRPMEPARVRQSVLAAVEEHPPVAIAGLPRGWGATALEPVFPRLERLSFHATPRPQPAAQPKVLSLLPLYPDNPPVPPVARLTPLDGDLLPPPRTGLLGGWLGAMSQAGGTGDGQHVWSHVTDFWQHAPRDLKLLAIAIPVLLGLALRPSLPKVRVKAPANNVAVAGSFGRGFEERIMNVRRNLADRAGVELNDDFRTGLDDWQSRGDLSTAWSFDRNGFVKPSALALYRPSMNLSDYQMEFLGLIDKKALSWVVRAADFDNYYVIKLVVLNPGPMPTIGITRYAVIHGQAQNRVDNVAAINARTDMLYRVNLNVRDDTYLLTLQGTVVDTWSDSRLTTGGIGFFSQPGEESRLRWVQVTHQYDMLGRLCAYLAPYNIPTANGSF